MVPILRALQYVYSLPSLRDEILRLVAMDVNGRSGSNRGRRGMTYWTILVLTSVRLGCGLDLDRLQDLAEQHAALRQMMGLGDWQRESFDWRRIRDNICLIRPKTLEEINRLVVQAGHELLPEAAKRVRADSFVVETNIHHPTESGVIFDGLRKIFPLGVLLSEALGVEGWRQHGHLERKAKYLCAKIARICSRKGPEYQERRKSPYKGLLRIAAVVTSRAQVLIQSVRSSPEKERMFAPLAKELGTLVAQTLQVCGVACRRIFKGEKVANREKLFSIFEPHTQLYKRGKAAKPIQFGRLVLVYEDQAGFLVHTHLMPRDAQDKDMAVSQTRIAQSRVGGRIEALSFDRGFDSPENQVELAKIVAHPCLPRKGALQGTTQARTASVEFREARQRHPGIESAIEALQAGNGLKRCRDRTEPGFERYIQLATLGRNLHVLGKVLIAREAPLSESCQTRRKSKAA